MRAMRRFVVGSVIAAVVAACASASVPVHNFSAVPVAAKSNPTLEQVGAAITKGGTAAGWQMSEVKPGHAIGTYRVRRHLAVVDVTYNTSTYDITFKHGDAGLKYDGQTIHQNYNSWVEDLEKVIRAHLNAL
ncbi:MAG TPA: hypothetical protein VFB93_10840 [Burkholderiales bacterium]|nr:hypothetical protein [Burkholderiales bacterium]